MLWRITQSVPPDSEAPTAADGRFVLHRHRDAGGPHLDLRLEQDGYLLGWRIEGSDLALHPLATEKMPHPVAWLDGAGDAVREDGGEYAWLERGADRRVVLLRGQRGERVLTIEPAASLPAGAIGAIARALAERGATPDDAANLIADGASARARAVARLCGLGRELDGDAFDEVLWRRSLQRMTLDEIHAQLRAYEVRYDLKYPPEPVSQPEPLPEDATDGRREAALTILRTP